MIMNMETFDDVIFEEDEFEETSTETTEDGKNDQPSNTEQSDNSELNLQDNDDDLTAEVLRLKGINNPEKIKFEDQSGAIIERDWNSLSREELINILTNQESDDLMLDDSEIELINLIRQSGLSPEEYINNLQHQQFEPVKQYQVDELSDDEIYALDLLHKIGSDISDEEINQALESAKLNETLFKKTVEGLRKEYIRLLEEEEAQQENELKIRAENAYKQFSDTIFNEISHLNSFAGQPLQLSNNDIEDLYSFMLELDDLGYSSFGKALSDPALYTKAAFWLLNEDKITEELNKLILDNYKRGYEQAKLDLKSKPKVVFNKPNSQQKSSENIFIDDEDWY